MTDNYQFNDYLQYPWLEPASTDVVDTSLLAGSAFQKNMSPLSSSSSFDTDLDVNWDAFANPAFLFPTTTTQSPLPPSPALSPKEINEPQVALARFLKEYENIDPELSFNHYPSPPLSTSPIPYIVETPTAEAQSPIHHQVESVQSPSLSQIDSIEPPIRRRGPGRPSKAQLAREKQEGRQSTKNVVTMRRVIHNDSAMRSRARFNTVLDELWNEVPERERMVADPSRQLCRAEKIEIVISYVRKLQKRNGRMGVY
jgi:hypothetical protein